MKIFTSGKIDIDGAVECESAYRHYDLLLRIFERFHDVIYTPTAAPANGDSTDEDTDAAPDVAAAVGVAAAALYFDDL